MHHLNSLEPGLCTFYLPDLESACTSVKSLSQIDYYSTFEWDQTKGAVLCRPNYTWLRRSEADLKEDIDAVQQRFQAALQNLLSNKHEKNLSTMKATIFKVEIEIIQSASTFEPIVYNLHEARNVCIATICQCIAVAKSSFIAPARPVVAPPLRISPPRPNTPLPLLSASLPLPSAKEKLPPNLSPVELKITKRLQAMGCDAQDATMRAFIKESIELEKARKKSDLENKLPAKKQVASSPPKAADPLEVSSMEREITERLEAMGCDPQDVAMRAFIKDSIESGKANENVSHENEQTNKMYEQILSPYFTLKDVADRGDCFFLAALGQIHPNAQDEQAEMLALRNAIADYLEADEKAGGYVAASIEGNFSEHIKHLRESAVGKANGLGQGEFIHALVINQLTKRPVYIYTYKDLDLGKYSDSQEMPLPGQGFRFGGEGEPICLVYNGVNHWMHLERK